MPMAKNSKADPKLLDRPNKRDWPAENLAERKVVDLKPYEKNARLHSEKQIDLIAKSIQEHGFTNRILIDPKNRIIAGHGRLEAAKKLGIESVPCLIAEGWTEAQIRAYVIKDNQLTIASDWDEALLIEELHALGDAGVELDALGFSEKELNGLLGIENEGEDLGVVLGGDRHLLQIEFESEADCAEMFAEVQSRGLKCAILT